MDSLVHQEGFEGEVAGGNQSAQEYQNLRSPEHVAAAEFYSRLASHIAEQTEAAVAQGATSGQEAAALVRQIIAQADESPMGFMLGPQNEYEVNFGDNAVRHVIGEALNRAAGIMIRPSEYAQEPQLLTSTQDLNEGQALAVQSELERFFGAMPAEQRGQFTTEIPGVLLHYQSDPNQPRKVAIRMSLHREHEAALPTDVVDGGLAPTANNPARPQNATRPQDPAAIRGKSETQAAGLRSNRPDHLAEHGRFRPSQTTYMVERPDLSTLANDGSKAYAEAYGSIRTFHGERATNEAGVNILQRLISERMADLDDQAEPTIANRELHDNEGHTAVSYLYDGLRKAAIFISPLPGASLAESAAIYTGPADSPVTKALESELQAVFQVGEETISEAGGAHSRDARIMPTQVPGFSLRIETQTEENGVFTAIQLVRDQLPDPSRSATGRHAKPS